MVPLTSGAVNVAYGCVVLDRLFSVLCRALCDAL